MQGTNAQAPAHRLGSRLRFGATIAMMAAAIAVLLAVPALGQAATASFGAKLNQSGYKAVKNPKKCKWDATEPCTRMPTMYAEPWPVNAVQSPGYAPHSGTITKIKLVARNSGGMRIQLGDTSNQALPMGEVDRNGPKIHYQGTGEVETFAVDIPVNKFEWIGFRSKRASTLNCNQPAGLESSFQFDPPLQPGDPAQVSSWQEECTHLIKAKMTY
jgi:hypothetical protein